MGLELSDCVAEAGAVLGCYVGWGLEGGGGFEEFSCCVYEFGEFVDAGAEFLLDIADKQGRVTDPACSRD